MGLYKFRVMEPGSSKAAHIVDSRAAVEALIPNGEHRIVKRYQGRKKLATYSVDRDMRGGIFWAKMAND